jgi:hypothetical protein
VERKLGLARDVVQNASTAVIWADWRAILIGEEAAHVAVVGRPFRTRIIAGCQR